MLLPVMSMSTIFLLWISFATLKILFVKRVTIWPITLIYRHDSDKNLLSCSDSMAVLNGHINRVGELQDIANSFFHDYFASLIFQINFILSGLSRNNLIITSSPRGLIPKRINGLSSPRAGPFTTSYAPTINLLWKFWVNSWTHYRHPKHFH